MRHAARLRHPLQGLHRLLALAALVLAACRATPVADAEFLSESAPGSYHTFAWLDEEGPAGRTDPVLDAEVRRAVDAELARVGQRKSSLAEADLIVSYTTAVETVDLESDPYITGHVAEQHELGTLTIELLDVDSGAPIWRGSTREKLRVSAVLFGGVTTNQFSPTDSERDWNVRERVAATLAPLAGRL